MSENAHDFVTCVLIYLSIGSVIWMLLDAFGQIDITRHARAGAPLVVATVAAIVMWPKIAVVFLRRMRA